MSCLTVHTRLMDIYELDNGEVVFYSNGGHFREELSDYYRRLLRTTWRCWEEIRASFYFLKNGEFYSQEFTERNDLVEAVGSLKPEKMDQLYDLEYQYGVDFDDDGEVGRPPVVIEKILSDGSFYGFGSLAKLESEEIVWFNNGEYYENGDKVYDYYHQIDGSNLGAIDIESAVASLWADYGPIVFSIMEWRTDYRDANGRLELDGDPVGYRELYAIENDSRLEW